MSQVGMASVYAFGKLQRSSPGQQTSPCSVCVTTGSNLLCGVDLTSNTPKTLHDSDQEVVQLELRCEYINMSSACGTGGTEDFMLWTSPLSCIAVSNTSTVLSLELPSVVSSLYTSKSARSVTSITVLLVSLLWSDNSCGMVCACCSRNTNNPSWHLSELDVLLLNACCLHNRWMIDPLRNCTQSPNLSTRRFFSLKVRHSETPLHAREVLTWIYHTKKILIHYTPFATHSGHSP